VNYNVAQCNGNMTKLQNVLAELHADDSHGFAVPVSIFVFVEVQSSDVATLTSRLAASAPPGVSYLQATFTNSNGAQDGTGGAPCMFYRPELFAEDTAAKTSFPTGGGRRTERWRMKLKVSNLVTYNNADAWFYVYGTHLKAGAGNDPPDFPHDTRWDGAQDIRANSNALAAGAHIIYCGDLNFYTRTEFGYLEYFTAGNGQAIDPLGTSEWTGPSGALKHTQSPLLNPVGSLIAGGMDDRFDFQLMSQEFNDGLGLSMIGGTYRAVGNDGNHYNQAINNGNNTYFPGNVARSNALATNLNGATDHIPVAVDYQVPAAIDAFVDYLDPIIQNTPNQYVTVYLRNKPPILTFADDLSYNVIGSGVVSGNQGDTISASNSYVTHDLPINTSTAGLIVGEVRVDSFSQGTHNDNVPMPLAIQILRPGNASFVTKKDRNSQTIESSFDANTGIQNLQVQVHNFAYDSNQSGLDIDSVTGVAPPFAFTGGLVDGVTSGFATLTFAFDTTGLANGPYVMNATIHTSDDDWAIGETTHSISLTWDVEVGGGGGPPPCPEDIMPIGGDGFVTISDINAVLTSYGLTCNDCLADIAPDGGDNQVTIADINRVLTAFGPCPTE
jgi:hypothetical protein